MISDGIHDGFLRVVVEGAGRLVKNHDLRVIIKGPGDGDALALAAGNAHAALADAGVKTLRKAAHIVVELRLLQDMPDFAVVDFVRRDAVGDVGTDGVIEHEHELRDVADVCVPAGQIRADVHAVHGDFAGARAEQAEENIDSGGFAGARGADETDGLADRNVECGVPQDIRLCAGIAVGDAVENDFLLERERGDRVGALELVVDSDVMGVENDVLDGVEGGRVVRDLVDIVGNPVGTRHDAHRHIRQDGHAAHHGADVSGIPEKNADHEQDAGDHDRLDGEAGNVVHRGLGDLNFAELTRRVVVLIDKIFLPVENLGLFHAIHGLHEPFCDIRVVLHDIIAVAAQNRSEDLFVDEKDQGDDAGHDQRHAGTHRQGEAEQGGKIRTAGPRSP